MFCPKCGTELPDGSVFCGSCGNKLAPAEQQAAQVASAAPATMMPSDAMPPIYQVKKPSKKPLVIGLAALAVVAAVGIGVYMAFFAPYSIDDKTFPDSDLRSAVTKQIDRDGDGKITRDEAKQVSKLDLSGLEVESLEGIQLFENITNLNLADTADLKHVDLSKLTKVEQLNAAGSALTELDVSALTSLKSLDISGTGIEEIDLSACANLSELKAGDSVDVSGLGKTQLREQWLVVSVEDDGYHGQIDAQAGGMAADKQITSYTYDEDLNVTEIMMEYKFDQNAPAQNSTNVYEYEYEDGLIVGGEQSYAGSSDTTKISITYADSGLLGLIEVERGSSSSLTKLKHEGEKISELAYRYGNNSFSYTNYLYDDNGRFVEMRADYQNFTIEYNDQGLVSTMDCGYELFEFDYDDKGRCTEKRFYWIGSDGKKPSNYTKVTFEYDNNGRIASATRESVGGKDFSMESHATLTYDDHGNLVKRDISYSYQSGSNSSSYEGTMAVTYKRVFVSNDAPEVKSPVLFGDPTSVITTLTPIRFDMFDDKQSDIVVSAYGMAGGRLCFYA